MAAAVFSACASVSVSLSATQLGDTRSIGAKVMELAEDENQKGIGAPTKYAAFNVTNGGVQKNAAEINTIHIEGEEINTVNEGAHAVAVEDEKLDIHDSTIITEGNRAFGIKMVGESSQAIIENSKISTKGESATGIELVGMATANLTNVSITVEGTGAYGLFLKESSEINLEETTIRALGNGGAAAYLSDGSTLTANNVTFTGQNGGGGSILPVYGGSTVNFSNSTLSNDGTGGETIRAKESTVNLRDTNVTMNGDGDKPALAGRNSKLNVNGGALHSKNGAAIWSRGGTSINLSGDVQVTSGRNVLLELRSDTDNRTDTGVPNVDSKSTLSMTNSAYGRGDIVNLGTDDLMVDVNLSSKAVWEGASESAIDQMTLADNAQWHMTASSQINNLDMANTRVTFMSAGGLKTLTLDALTGNGEFVMRVNPEQGLADEINITGEAKGNHRLLISSTGDELVYANAIQVVQAAAGDAQFSLSNRGGVVDAGSFQYVLERSDGEEEGASRWNLILGDKPSESTGSGINQADAPRLASLVEMAALSGRFRELRRVDSVREQPLRMTADSAGVRQRGKQTQVWGQTYGAEHDVDNGAGRPYQLNVTGMQFGVDKEFADDDSAWYLGLMTTYSQLNADFGNSSSGKAKSYGLGTYLSWMSDNGAYLDLIGKMNWYASQFTANASDGSISHGSYRTPGFGVSAELGRRLPFAQHWFITPYAQMALNKIRGAGYRADNGIVYRIADNTSWNMRAGAMLGRSLELDATRTVEPFVKLAAVLDRGSRTEVLSNDNAFYSDLNGRGLEFGAGVTVDIDKKHRFNLQVQATQGGKVTQKWGVNAGYRMAW